MPFPRPISEPAALQAAIRVLLADDSREDYVTLRDLLARAGMAAPPSDSAPGGEELWCVLEWVSGYDPALEALLSERFDVALVDAALGDDKGTQLVEHAIACGCQLPMLLITGEGGKDLDRQALAVGAADFLEKDRLTPSALRRSVTYAVERSRLIRVLEDQARSLARSQESFRVLARNADGLLVVDGRGAVRYANPAAEAIFEAKPGALVGTTFPHTLGKPGELRDLRVEGAMGERRSVQVRVSDVVWDGEPASLASMRDVTELRQAEEELLHGQKMNVVGRLAGTIAHDFNNILAGIVGHLDMARLYGTSPEHADNYIREAIMAAERATQLTRGLLDFARKRKVPDDVVPLHRVAVRLEPMLRQVVGRRHELTLSLGEGDPFVKVHTGELEQVLLNLVTNARDAMPGGGVVRVHVGRRDIGPDSEPGATFRPARPKAGRYAFVRVEDQGEGMDEATVRKALDPFFTTKEVGAGTGLGLAIIYDIVQHSGGAVLIESQAGGGSSVEALFPIAAERHDEVLRARRDLGPERERRSTILVVDDERSIRALVKGALEAAGHEVITANDGVDALRLCQDRRPELDLVVTDIAMPGLDGFELAESLSPLFPGLPILFMSGYGDDAAFRRGIDRDAVKIIDKPFRVATFLTEVRSVLEATG